MNSSLLVLALQKDLISQDVQTSVAIKEIVALLYRWRCST